jgi:hypothetical protein
LKLNTSSFWSYASGSEKLRRPRSALNGSVGTHEKRRLNLSNQVPCLTTLAGIRHADDLEGERRGLCQAHVIGQAACEVPAQEMRDAICGARLQRKTEAQATGLQRHEEKC